jgi:hypothetical protein
VSELWTPDTSTRLNVVIVSPRKFTNLSELADWCNTLTVHQQGSEVYKIERILSVQVVEQQGRYEALLLCEALK